MKDKLSEKIYSSIKLDIENGLIDSRTFLTESQTAKKFSVSKAPVRDAFHLLCSQGYLISYPRKGYMVNLFSNDEINQIQVVRKHLEKLSIRLVIENANDEEIKLLYEYTKIQLNNNDPSKTNNSLFHLKLAKLSKNEYLPIVLNELLIKASQSQIKEKSNFQKHNNIIDALLERNYEKAILCLDEDIIFL